MDPIDSIPGIGATFASDFARIGVRSVGKLKGRDPERLFERLVEANSSEHHATSKNYLYVIRMAVYYANGGRDPTLLKWNAWKDPPKAKGSRPSSQPRATKPRRVKTEAGRARL